MAHILIVEDDPDILALLELRMTSYGHDVMACTTPSKALQAINHGYVPEVACLDIGLPEMDGFYLWYRLRRHPRLNAFELPTIFISAYNEPECVVEGRALGATYLTKPFSPTSLQQAVAHALASGASARRAPVAASRAQTGAPTMLVERSRS
jgi:CheY-like chemotaxis protein